MKKILTIAASDTSAGAGIQQDLKTITSLGHYGVTAITALTAQNTHGIIDMMEVPTIFFRAELEALLCDIHVDAVKIGVIPNKEIAQTITSTLRQLDVPIVLDPVLASSSGWQFLNDDCVEYIKDALFPLCTLVTPNISEAARLLGATTLPLNAGEELVKRFSTAFLIKGGHSNGEYVCDSLYTEGGTKHDFSSQRIHTHNLHGTGCTLSSAVATLLATGLPLVDSVAQAKKVTQEGIRRGRNMNIGSGNGPLLMSRN